MSYWKIYRIARIILGRKRMKRLIVTLLLIAGIGVGYFGTHPEACNTVAKIYQEHKTDINAAAGDLAHKLWTNTTK